MKNLQLFDFTKQNFDQALIEIIFREQALWQRLVYLRHIAPNAYLSAGVIRNLVWSVLHGQTYDVIHSEIDVIFFDEHEEHQRITHEITRQLIQNFPYASLHEALSVWPETATAIAIRLLENDDLEIIAPFGLYDLFALKLRWNDRLVSHDVFMQRVMSKRFLQRWEKLEIVS